MCLLSMGDGMSEQAKLSAGQGIEKRKRHAGGRHSWTGKIRERKAIEQGWLCFWCQRWMYSAGEHPQLSVTADHIRPLRLGGRNSHSNIVAACSQCNHYRNSKGDPVDFQPHWHESTVGRREARPVDERVRKMRTRANASVRTNVAPLRKRQQRAVSTLGELAPVLSTAKVAVNPLSMWQRMIRFIRSCFSIDPAPVAQLEERRFSSSECPGSNPGGGAK